MAVEEPYWALSLRVAPPLRELSKGNVVNSPEPSHALLPDILHVVERIENNMIFLHIGIHGSSSYMGLSEKTSLCYLFSSSLCIL